MVYGYVGGGISGKSELNGDEWTEYSGSPIESR